MDSTPVSQLRLQLARARQRLFWQTWLNFLPGCCALLLVVAAGWLLVQPYLLGLAAPWLRWTLLGGVLLAGAALAFGLACWRGPSLLEAALTLDERFGLKERTTTALSLTPEQIETPAGQALLADLQEHLAKLNVGSRFPLRLEWRRGLLPAAAAVLAVLAVFFEPAVSPMIAEAKDPNILAADKAEAIEKALAEAKKKLAENEKKDPPKSKPLQELNLEMKQVFDTDIDSKDKEENRKKVEEIQKLEEKNAKQLEEAQKAVQKKAEVEQKLKDLNELTNKDKNKDGPAKDLLDALNNGDGKKTEEELKKLQDKLADNKLNEEEKKKLADQLEQVQKKAEKLAEKEKEVAKQLEEAKKSGEPKEKIEQLQLELQKQQDMKKLSEELKECQACTKEGDGKKAAEKLGKAGEQMQKAAAQKGALEKEKDQLAEKSQEIKQLQQNQKTLEDTRKTICQNLGMGGGPAGPGPRPEAKTNTGVKDTQVGAELDPKGQFKVVGDGPNMAGTKTMIPSKDLSEVFQQTAQKEQQAIERQPISQEAAELLKGYYQNLSGQQK